MTPAHPGVHAPTRSLRRGDAGLLLLAVVSCCSLRPHGLAAAVVRSTVGLAHTLGLRLVAEGVETPESLVALRESGCDVVQGYHLSLTGSTT